MTDSQGLLSQGMFLMASLESEGTFGFVASPKTITRGSGSFVTDGVVVGAEIYTSDTDNPGPFTVTAVDATTITVSEAVVAKTAYTVTLTVYIPVGEASSFSGFDGESGEIDMTHLQSTAKEFRTGLEDFGNLSADMNFLADDPGQGVLKAMKSDRTRRPFILRLPAAAGLDGYQWAFSGSVKSLTMSAGADEKLTKNLTIRISGAVTETVIAAV